MQEKQIEQFREIVFDPYNEAWQIMKWMRDKEPKDDKFWEEYMAKCDAFHDKFKSEIGGSIYRVLLDAGSEVGRIEKSC